MVRAASILSASLPYNITVLMWTVFRARSELAEPADDIDVRTCISSAAIEYRFVRKCSSFVNRGSVSLRMHPREVSTDRT
jgi:hypothetical protein